MDLLPGQSIGRYHIIERLGEGGMAIVYKAYDTRLEREVAIKVIRVDQFPPAILENILKRFEREAKALARLNHPNIVPVIDYGDFENVPYLVMVYQPGGTLKAKMGKPMLWADAMRLLLPVARGLAYAHQTGIVHRDIKPSNILITESGEPMLTDFGIAKLLASDDKHTLTGTGVGIGTPEYMAPEQGLGKTIDGRADIYSLGIVLYEMVTGRKPYNAETPMAVVLKHVTDPLPPPRNYVHNLPDAVEKLLLKALAKDPDDRFENMAAFIKVMEACLYGISDLPPQQTQVFTVQQPDQDKTLDQPIQIQTPVKVKPVQKKFGWGLAALGLFGIILVGGIATWSFLASTKAEPTPAPTAVIEKTFTPNPAPAKPVAPSSPVPQTNADGTITIWYSYNAGSSEGTAFLETIALAQKEFPGLKINAEPIPFADVFTLYRQKVTEGGGPEMFIAPNDSLGDFARDGLLANISVQVMGKLDSYLPPALDGMKVGGSLYGIPESLKAVSLYYNRSMMPAAPSTTAALKQMMQSGTPVAVSLGCYHHYGFFGSFGGKIFDLNWKIVADQGGVSDAMDYLRSLHAIAVGRGWPVIDAEGSTAFTSGKVAAITNGNWMLADYRTALGDNLAVAPLPSGPGGPATPMLGVDGFYFNPKSKNILNAVKVALFLTTPKLQEIMMAKAGHVPANSAVKFTDPLMKSLLDSFKFAYVRPQVPELAKYWTNFCNTDEVFVNGVPAVTWVRNATDQANK